MATGRNKAVNAISAIKAKSQWEISLALDVTSGNIGEVGQWRDVGYRLSPGRERPLT